MIVGIIIGLVTGIPIGMFIWFIVNRDVSEEINSESGNDEYFTFSAPMSTDDYVSLSTDQKYFELSRRIRASENERPLSFLESALDEAIQ